ncbi:MAG: nicotinamide-nucleotide amidohydrolase family protein [Saprospiraceae bacterium]|nr:nicotinamide-nucleotide amidohydrolase family protein [Saprospiraceae bacterium]
MPENVKLAYLPSLGTVRLRLTARGENELILQEQIEKLKTTLVELVKPAVAGFDDETMPEIIGKILKGSQLTLATVESCTGGYLAHLITGVAGSSEYYRGGIVSYSNDLKINELSVKKETLAAHGAVSEETVREMIRGALNRYGSDIAVATTGIAGPNGGSPEKPVGTVWIAVGDKNNIVTFKWGADRGRAKNIEYASNIALNMIRKFVLNRK